MCPCCSLHSPALTSSLSLCLAKAELRAHYVTIIALPQPVTPDIAPLVDLSWPKLLYHHLHLLEPPTPPTDPRYCGISPRHSRRRHWSTAVLMAHRGPTIPPYHMAPSPLDQHCARVYKLRPELGMTSPLDSAGTSHRSARVRHGRRGTRARRRRVGSPSPSFLVRLRLSNPRYT